jgi:hypothetical protein
VWEIQLNPNLEDRIKKIKSLVQFCDAREGMSCRMCYSGFDDVLEELTAFIFTAIYNLRFKNGSVFMRRVSEP